MKLNLILTKTFKFITFVIFTFMALVYFGVLLIIPLDIMVQLVKLLHGVGLPTVAAVVAGMGALGYLGWVVSRMPELYTLLFNIGIEIATFGNTQIKRFDALIESMQPAKAEDTAA
ncbi:hypothetical protein FJZ55_06935 [Candidatus Woesearchaeota archaeon]|jgi:hypothetical protein|nr:hypothetical protein [Candidatus Woesearchaeota archaeon]